MNVFSKRPLCLILCIGLCGFFLYSLEIELLQVILIFSAILLFIISMFLRKHKDRRVLFRICAIALIISCLSSHFYFNRYFKAYELYDGEVEIEGVVEGIKQTSSYTTRLHVRADKINGKNSNYEFYAYAKKADTKGVIEGTRVSFLATLEGFSDESRSFNIAKGINAYASDVKSLKIIEYTDGGIEARFAKMREYITRYIMSKSDKDTGAIVSALLLGERDYLPDQLRLDFRRIGISHILALSGMHLAVLSLGIEKVLSFFYVKKKTRIVVTTAFVVIYMALTGFSVSVVRAGIMLIISSLLFLLSRGKDSLTSLSVAVTLICLINPNAIFDISLQLSALATFGIIVLGEISSQFKKPKTIKDKILSYLTLSFLASVFAISATIFVSVFNFGGISILAPIATIIFSIFAELIMYLGCMLILIGWLLPVGILLKPLCLLMKFLAGLFSSIKFAYVSANFSFVIILIIIYSVMFYLLTIIRLKKPLKALNLLVVMFLLITTLPMISTINENRKETVAYYSSSKCDQMLVRSDNEVCLINSAQYAENLAYTTLDLLDETKVTYLDKYYLTHYSWSIDDELDVLLSNVIVKYIYLPAPRNNDENTILKILYKTIEDHRTNIVIFQEYETVPVGDYNINLLYSAPYGQTSMNAFAISKKDTVYTYISSGLLVTNMEKWLSDCISLSDCVIFGEHGKKYKEKIYFDKCYSDVDFIIINSENLFLNQENMQYYLNNGCEIFAHPKEFVYLK